MSSSRVKKPSVKSRGQVVAQEADRLRTRREEHFQLHDEADLVNFRADALNRYITNQDLMENVVSKLLHTSRLVPPSSFPKQHKKLYASGASEADLIGVVRGLKRGELFSGDLRLMRAKQKLGAQEIEQLWAENSDTSAATGGNDTPLLSEETQFQKQAVARLAAASAKCVDAETLLELEESLNTTLNEYKKRFNREYTLAPRETTRHAIPLAELAPGVKLSEAPANYNPRSIMSFVDLAAKVPSAAVPTSAGGSSAADRIAHEISQGVTSASSGNENGPEDSVQVPATTGNQQFNSGVDFAMDGASNERFDDFDILGDENDPSGALESGPQHSQSHVQANEQSHGQNHEDSAFDPQLIGAEQGSTMQDQRIQDPGMEGDARGESVLSSSGSAVKTMNELDQDTGSGPESVPVSASGPATGTGTNIETDAGAEELGAMGNDVDMDDLDRFLAGPSAGDGMDDMDALMNFDHGNENDEVMGFAQNHENEGPSIEEDDPFNVDFLTHMGDDME